MINFHKTYRINTTDTTDRVDINHSRLCYINSVGAYGWCDNLSKLSEIFLDAQVKSKFSSGTPHYTIVLPEFMFNKFKEEDQYIAYDRIEFIINTFTPPDNGIIISVYVITDDYDRSLYVPFWEGEARNESAGVEWPFVTNVLWKMKNKKLKKTHVTWQKLDNTFQKDVFGEFPVLEENIGLVLDEYEIPYEVISYTMTPQETYDLMSRSSLHISYVGASWWLAHYMGVPVLDYNLGRNYFGHIRAPGKAKDYAQMTWNEIENKFEEIKHGPIASFPKDSTIDNVKEYIFKHVSI